MTPEEMLELDAKAAFLQGWRWYRRKTTGKCVLVPPKKSKTERTNWEVNPGEFFEKVSHWPSLEERYSDWDRSGIRRFGKSGYAEIGIPHPTTDARHCMELLDHVEAQEWCSQVVIGRTDHAFSCSIIGSQMQCLKAMHTSPYVARTRACVEAMNFFAKEKLPHV